VSRIIKEAAFIIFNITNVNEIFLTLKRLCRRGFYQLNCAPVSSGVMLPGLSEGVD
jgi:hypothetical protein